MSNSKNNKKMLQVLEKMAHFNLTPNSETIRDYVVPYLRGGAPEQLLNDLTAAGVPLMIAMPHLVNKVLTDNKINEAAKLVKKVNMYYSAPILRRALTQSLVQTNNYGAYVEIVRQIYDNFKRRELIQSNLDEDTSFKDQEDVVGYLVLDLLNSSSSMKNSMEIIEKLLEALVTEGLSLSNGYAQKIQEKLGEKMTEKISNLLGKKFNP